jgi:hypothetical protein
MNNTKYPRLIACRLTEKQYQHLIKESKRDKTDMSQLVRWALDIRYRLGE